MNCTAIVFLQQSVSVFNTIHKLDCIIRDENIQKVIFIFVEMILNCSGISVDGITLLFTIVPVSFSIHISVIAKIWNTIITILWYTNTLSVFTSIFGFISVVSGNSQHFLPISFVSYHKWYWCITIIVAYVTR